MKTKNIFKCTKCKGQKVRTRNPIGYVCDTCELPKLIEANKPTRTGRVEKKGDREKLEKALRKITGTIGTMGEMGRTRHTNRVIIKNK